MFPRARISHHPESDYGFPHRTQLPASAGLVDGDAPPSQCHDPSTLLMPTTPTQRFLPLCTSMLTRRAFLERCSPFPEHKSAILSELQTHICSPTQLRPLSPRPAERAKARRTTNPRLTGVAGAVKRPGGRQAMIVFGMSKCSPTVPPRCVPPSPSKSRGSPFRREPLN